MQFDYFSKLLTILLGTHFSLSVNAQSELYINGAAIFIDKGASIKVNGSITNLATSTFQNQGTVALNGNFTNNQTMVDYSGILKFNGSALQTISGAADLLAKAVELNNSAGFTLNSVLKIDSLCTFTAGIVNTLSNSTPLWFTSNANYASVSDLSHVNGFVVKEGTTDFEYPVGDANKYQMIKLIPSANASGIRVKYYATDAGSAPFTGSTPLTNYNSQEYWDVSPISTATAVLQVYWDNYKNSGIVDFNDLRVAHLSGGNWLNEGFSVEAGNSASSGFIKSNALSTWSPITIGSVGSSNPLPSTWMTFNANVNANGFVNIYWKVNEINISDYEIEKSIDGLNFQSIGSLDSKGDGINEYQFVEKNYVKRISEYYRIKQKDREGKVNYSKVIELGGKKDASFVVYPTIFHDFIIVESPVKQQIFLISLNGKVVKSQVLQSGKNKIFTNDILPGNYYLINSIQKGVNLVKP